MGPLVHATTHTKVRNDQARLLSGLPMSVVGAFPALSKSARSGISHGLADETMLFNERQIEFLAGRGLIHLTARCDGDETWGTVIAASRQQAARIAASRHPSERPIGLMGFGFLAELRNSIRLRLARRRQQRPSIGQ